MSDGTTARSDSPAAAADQRGAERSPSGPGAWWRLLAAPGDHLLPAAVSGLSRTGLGLLSAEAVRPGAILVIRLSDASDRPGAPRLAHVRHATPHADGGYLVGCAFRTPLEEDELADLLRAGHDGAGPGAAPGTASGAMERRATPRRKVPLTRVVLWEPLSEARSQGWVTDLSRGGLGVLALRPFRVGLDLRVRALHAAEVVPWVEVAVRGCRRHGERWLVGCQFRGEPHPHGLRLLG